MDFAIRGDFIEYWSALRLFLNGLNPYDPELIFSIQQVIDPAREVPLMMWNPPWLIVLLSPILSFDFLTAWWLWQILGVFFKISGVVLVYKAFTLQDNISTKNLFYGAVFIILFPPLLVSTKLGQLGDLMFFSFSLLYYGLIRKKQVLVTLALLLLSVKPHLGALVVVCLLVSHRSLILRSVTSMIALIFLTEMASYGSVFYWYKTLSVRSLPLDVPIPLMWKTGAVIPELARWLNPKSLDDLDLIIKLLWAFSSAFIALLYYFDYRRSKEASLKILLPCIITLSLLISPFCWIFDYGPVAILGLCLLFSLKKKTHILMFLSLSFLPTILVLSFMTRYHQHHLFLAPTIFTFLLAALLTRRHSKP